MFPGPRSYPRCTVIETGLKPAYFIFVRSLHFWNFPPQHPKQPVSFSISLPVLWIPNGSWSWIPYWGNRHYLQNLSVILPHFITTLHQNNSRILMLFYHLAPLIQARIAQLEANRLSIGRSRVQIPAKAKIFQWKLVTDLLKFDYKWSPWNI